MNSGIKTENGSASLIQNSITDRLMNSAIKPKNRKWFCQFDTEFYYGLSNELWN